MQTTSVFHTKKEKLFESDMIVTSGGGRYLLEIR